MDQAQCLAILRRCATEPGAVATSIEGLTLINATARTAPTPGVYPCGVCIIVQGSKQALLDDQVYTYDSNHYLCCAVPIPVQAAISQASPKNPLLGVLVRTDTPTMRDTCLRMESSNALPRREDRARHGLCVATWSPEFTLALCRLLELLENPNLIPVLAESRLRELMVAILQGEAGPSMRQSYGASLEIAQAIAHLREQPAQEVSVEDLAKRCGMSRAAFHKKFKETTHYSRIQFIKALRLNEAAMMLSLGHNAGQAANKVGYSSPSQFSREFRRHFGQSPKEWAAKNRLEPDETH